MAYQKKDHGFYTEIHNEGGPVLGVKDTPVIEEDGLAFKDLSKTGTLLPYEDWRLTPEERAADLAGRLTVEEIAGLTLFSAHQQVPAAKEGRFSGTYDGKPFDEEHMHPWALTDQQKVFLTKDGIRTVLVTEFRSAETAVRWNNAIQDIAEHTRLGIPVTFSSDPRHGTKLFSGRETGKKLEVSKWPQGYGLGATFDRDLVYRYGQAVSKEYRAMGITNALSPQIDLATEPRWNRSTSCFSAHPELSADMAKAYCDGMQTTAGEEKGWGKESVAAMAKHFPGGGTGEGGRDAHFGYGKYAVYPGNNLKMHLRSFTEGALSLDGPTKCCAAIMPYYTISFDQDPVYGENVGNSYSRYMISDLLRGELGYEGVICTDWGVTHDPGEVDTFGKASHGVEEMPRDERILKLILNGVDQFGGDNEVEPVLAAYRLGVSRYGEEKMRARFEETAKRILLPMFRVGLFENPYLDLAESEKTIRAKELVDAGYEAQLRSLILVKNKNNVLPLKKGTKVYIPDRFIRGKKDFFGNQMPDRTVSPVPKEDIAPFYELVDSPDEAEAFLVFMDSPSNDAYSAKDKKNGGNGYLPISLQYRPYTAEFAREVSIAGGDFREESANRSYKGKTVTVSNEADLDNVLKMREMANGRPVIAVVTLNHMAVPAEYEPFTDGILLTFGVENKALFSILSGETEPSGLLPALLPRDMKTVEEHCEDLPFDMACYVDEMGNAYDFGFGLNYHGTIEDERTKRYQK